MEYITCADMKKSEQMANDAGLSYYDMMENAGTEAVKLILNKLKPPKKTSFAIFCGKGNNGGDGFVMARLLSQAGMKINIVLVEGLPQTKDAMTNYKLLENIKIYDSVPDSLKADIVIDAIYGTGFHGKLRDNGLKAINLINLMKSTGSFIISVDIPSGLNGDVAGGDDLRDTICIVADETITFHRAKLIHQNNFALKLCGVITVADIGIDQIL